jgi:hypothetical protein
MTVRDQPRNLNAGVKYVLTVSVDSESEVTARPAFRHDL